MAAAILLFGGRASAAEVTDRIVAISAGSAITWSGALREANCQAFLDGQPPVSLTISDAASIEKLGPTIDRLADQMILEKVRQRSPLATDASEAGTAPTVRWDALVATYPSAGDLTTALGKYGLDADVLKARLAREDRLMTFVDYSLRPQIRIDSSQLSAYYENEFLPQFKSEQPEAKAPALDDVRFQIEEILVQRGINQQIGPWLDSLKKEQGMQHRLLPYKDKP